MYSLDLEVLVTVSLGTASLLPLSSGDELGAYSFCFNPGSLRAAVTLLSVLLFPRTKHAAWGELASHQVACLALCNHLSPYPPQQPYG